MDNDSKGQVKDGGTEEINGEREMIINTMMMVVVKEGNKCRRRDNREKMGNWSSWWLR
jgi:hypothetical protein